MDEPEELDELKELDEPVKGVWGREEDLPASNQTLFPSSGDKRPGVPLFEMLCICSTNVPDCDVVLAVVAPDVDGKGSVRISGVSPGSSYTVSSAFRSQRICQNSKMKNRMLIAMKSVNRSTNFQYG
jgi:hypothetical protein